MNNLVLQLADEICSLAITRLSISEQINAIPTATVEITLPANTNNIEQQDWLQAAHYQVNQKVIVKLDNQPLFSGYLVRKKIRLKGKSAMMILEARHQLQQLLTPPRCQVYRQQSDSAILSALLQKAGIEVILQSAQLAKLHAQMVQFRSSDWNFIRSRLFAVNCWLLPDAASNQVIVQPLVTTQTKAHSLTRNAGQHAKALYEININFDDRFTLEGVALQGWDIAEQHLSSEQKSNSREFKPWEPALESTPSQVRPQRQWQQAFSYLPETVLSTLAQSYFNHRQLTAVQGNIILTGTHDFHCGERVLLSEFSAGIDGSAIITGVSQLFDNDYGWRTELILGMPNDIMEIAPTIQGLHVAVVADFSEDPEQLERIPVHLASFAPSQEVIYARQGKPYASKDSGFCFYPEPGDEVIIGFIECDPRYPIILGAMHNPKNFAPLQPGQQNNQKILRFKNNDTTAQILFDSQANEIHFSAKKISQQAENNLSLASNQIDITGSNINMQKK